MNPDIDDLVRHAARRQEQLAVDPDRIRAALPARAARRRRTRTRVLLATVASAVAVAVAVPVVVLRDNGNGAGPAAARFTAPTVPLYYRPTWLPAGMTERSRVATIAAEGPKIPTSRVWKSTPAGDGSGPRLDLTSLTPMSGEGTTSNVDINGKPGYYDGHGSVEWQADEDTRLRLAAVELGLSEDVLLKIARSVVPDPTLLRSPLSLGWLPEGGNKQTLQVKGDSPSGWEAALSTNKERYFLEASVGTTPNTADGETITINGRTAHLSRIEEPTDQVLFPTNWLLTMDLGDGRHLTVRVGTGGTPNPLTRADVIRIAEHVQADPNPDIGWLGH